MVEKRVQGFGESEFAKVSDYVFVHRDRPISLARMAEVAGMPKTAFCKGFKAYLGITSYRYVLECRVVHAAALIRGGASIGDAAAELGFADHSHFTRRYQAIVGRAPSARSF